MLNGFVWKLHAHNTPASPTCIDKLTSFTWRSLTEVLQPIVAKFYLISGFMSIAYRSSGKPNWAVFVIFFLLISAGKLNACLAPKTFLYRGNFNNKICCWDWDQIESKNKEMRNEQQCNSFAEVASELHLRISN